MRAPSQSTCKGSQCSSKSLDSFPITCKEQDVSRDWALIRSLESNQLISGQVRAGQVRSAVVVIIGSHKPVFENMTDKKFVDFRANFPALDKHLLAPHKMALVLLYDFPANSGHFLHLREAIHNLSWTRPVSTDTAPDGEWRSPLGSRLLVKGRSFLLPEYIQRKTDLLDRPDWLGCAGSRLDVSYNLYSGAAYGHHIFFEPILADNFDYVLKVDLDIRFLEQAPEAPGDLMHRQGCLFLHSQIKNRDNDCQDGAFEATTAFASIVGEEPASARHRWCREIDYFYGNFIGFKMAFFSSPAQLYFSRWIYECVEDGYFRRRWGDQAAPPQKLCLVRDIEDLTTSVDICDLQEWRNTVFKHK